MRTKYWLPVLLAILAAASTAGAGDPPIRAFDEDEKEVAPPVKLECNSSKEPIPVWLGYGGYTPYAIPKTNGPRVKLEAPLDFMEQFYYVAKYQEKNSKEDFRLIVRLNKGQVVHVGWVEKKYLVLEPEAMKDSKTDIHRKGLIVNSLEFIKNTPDKVNLEQLTFRFGPRPDAKGKDDPERLYHVLFVYAQADGHVLLGSSPTFNTLKGVQGAQEAMYGWLPKERVCIWNTREGCEWDSDSTLPTAKKRRRTPGQIFRTLKDAATFLDSGSGEAVFQEYRDPKTDVTVRLKDGGSFLIPEPLWAELRQRNPNPRFTNLVSGAVPDDWQRLPRLPEEVVDYLREKDIRRPPHPAGEPRADKRVWSFRAASPMRLDDWKKTLDGIRERLVANGRSDGKEFVRGAAGFNAEPELYQVEIPDYTWATVYVKDVRQLPAAARVASGLLYDYNKDAIERIEGISRTVATLSGLLTVALAIFACLVAANLYSIQKLRVMQKDAEIGWLKAMGLPNRWLGAIFLAQAAILWVGGLAAGLLLGALAGELIARGGMRWISASEAFACHWPLWFWFVVTLVPGAICLGATWRATGRARTTPPIESLASG